MNRRDFMKAVVGGAALGALPLLTEDINRQAGTGAPFQQALSRGTTNLASQYAPFGLSPDSSAFARSASDLNASLFAQDTSQLRDARFRLAGLGPNVLGAATGLYWFWIKSRNDI